ncbi:MAG: tetratricopeptide repeat protein [Myxococcaceae bacterium]
MRLLALVLLFGLCACPAATTSGATGKLSKREQAHLSLEKNEPDKAIPLLDELVAESPADYDLLRMRAEGYVKGGRSQELLKKTTGNSAQDHYTRGLLLFARAQDTQAAVNEFQAGVAAAPAEPELHYRLGIALLESEQYDKALPPLLEAARLAPDRRAYQLPLAKALYRNGRSKEAVDALRRVALSNPTPAEVVTARQLMTQIADPFANFPKAMEGKLDQGMKWLNQMDVPQQAIIAFEEILHDYPDLASVHGLLGLAYQRIDDAGRAVEEFKHAIELDPQQGRPHYYLGVLYQARQRPEVAREEFQKAIDLDPFLDDAWGRLGDLAMDRGDAPAAQKMFQVQAALTPDAVLPRSKLALALQAQGDFAAAEQELRKVLDRDPENVELQLRMGLLFADKKKQSSRPADREAANAEAEKWLHKVLDAQPDNAIASQALETLHAM